MTDEHIEEVLNLYTKRETVEKESYLATFEDIEKNDFNLNIPRYVDNFEKEEEVDLNALLVDMQKTDEELGHVEGEFLSLLKDLTSSDASVMTSLNDLIAYLFNKEGEAVYTSIGYEKEEFGYLMNAIAEALK